MVVVRTLSLFSIQPTFDDVHVPFTLKRREGSVKIRKQTSLHHHSPIEQQTIR